MKKKLLLFLMFFIPTLSFFAYDFEVNGLYYNLDTDNMTVSVAPYSEYGSYNAEAYKGDIVIPSTINYNSRLLSVTGIANNAFYGCNELSSIIIPNTVTEIGEYAFCGCKKLSSISMSENITRIQRNTFAFTNISNLYFLPKKVSRIESNSFEGTSIETLYVPDNIKYVGQEAFARCKKLKTVSFGSGLRELSDLLFYECENLSIVDIPNTIKSIHAQAISKCPNLSVVRIGNSVSTIDNFAFKYSSIDSLIFVDGELSCQCYGTDDRASFSNVPINYLYLGRNIYRFNSWKNDSLKSLTIGKGLKDWEVNNDFYGKSVYSGENVTVIRSHITNPTQLSPKFSHNVYVNAILYVPKGTKKLYEQSIGWKNFFTILEDEMGPEVDIKKCSKPTISYLNDKLIFDCATEGATCLSSITDSDITSYSTNEVNLNVTYNISVYATKPGYENSEVATATLCWIDQLPDMKGIAEDEDIVTEVKAMAVLIQSEDGTINVKGAEDGTNVSVYEVNGRLVGSMVSYNGQANLRTNLQSGSTAIVKIEDRSIKVLIK